MDRRHEKRKTIIQSISWRPEVFNLLQKVDNISEYANNAVWETYHYHLSKEGKIQMKETQAKEMIKELNRIKDEIDELRGKKNE